ncbi:hypothetical protein [Pseudoalteromonas aurantia]|uniref:Uncharacterized protein n=1 Tax=Pseudoalteromonas aurantia TaxID=43654 RepID=A0A5S3V1W5_9GAMM|nr:hypothetical protein [Pseudoalteromonas aurantia]TMO64436.1 hypothetical protein CWC19_18365 [Pseudoalteromonas aurantia]
MWADLWDGIVETAGDVGNSVLNAAVEIEKEKARQPDVLKAKEPVKTKLADGTTMVAKPVVAPLINQNTLLIGGGILTAIVVVFLVARK